MSGRLVMALALAPGAAIESADSEPVVVEVDGESVVLTLDQGDRLVFDRAELAAAVDAKRAGSAAA